MFGISTSLAVISIISRKFVGICMEPIITPLSMLTSGTFLFPLQVYFNNQKIISKGISYFTTHPVLWAYMMTVVIPEIIVASITFFCMYSVLFPLQAALFTFLNGPAGIVTAFLIIWHQSAVFTRKLLAIFVLPTPLKMLFDAVMTREGCDDLVILGHARREIKVGIITRVRNTIRTLPKSIIYPKWLIAWLGSMALNTIPIIGPAILVIIAAPSRGRRAHRRYFYLKGLSSAEESHFVRARRGQYTGFGLVSGLLETVPVLGSFFLFTNTVSAALWAANIEHGLRRQATSVRLLGKKKLKRFWLGK